MHRLAGLAVAFLVALAPAAAAQQYPPQPGASAEVEQTVELGSEDDPVVSGTAGAGVTANEEGVDADATLDVRGAALSRFLEDGSLTADGSALAAIGLAGALALAIGSASVLRQRRSSRTIAS